MLFNSLLLALRAIRRNLLRSFLTILGIVIGVSSVITMITLGNGATRAVQEQIAALGTNLLMVVPGQRFGPGRGSGGSPGFQVEDGELIAQQIGGVQAVAPQASLSAVVVAETGGGGWSATIVGTQDAYFAISNWTFVVGRSFTPAEEQAGGAVCVIGEAVRREAFGNAPASTLLGSQLRIRQMSCEVIGVLRSKGQAAMGGDQDNIVVLPLNTVQRRLTGSQTVSLLLVSMQEGSTVERLKASLTDLLRERRRLSDREENNFTVLDTQQLSDAMSSSTQVLTMLLAAVAGVSLLVGGIGIMNIMLVSVTERTREIGIRLAIGATAREVLLQFLIEAVVLAAFGGLAGLVLAAVLSGILTTVMEVPYGFDPLINLLSFLFAASIGVAFGYLPARRAARLNPVEALRHE